MATSNSTALCDNSTLANFKAWAQLISNALAAFGWVQASDTGQVNWGTIASVPGTNAYVYEVWKPGDALTVFYVKVEYGNNSFGSNKPNLRLSIGTTTNGAGTMSGFFFGPITCAFSGYNPPGSGGGLFNCYFSGDTGRFGALMWREAGGPTVAAPQFIGIERSRDSTGVYTGTHATVYTGGYVGSGSPSMSQQTLYFSIGAGPDSIADFGSNGGINARGFRPTTGDSSFNNGIPFDTATAEIGTWDYPGTICGAGWGAAYTEAVTFTVTLFGSTVTYLPTKFYPLSNCINKQGNANANGTWAFCMRYD